MKRYAVIVAGGSGSRMGGGMPKQFRDLSGRPVLWWSMKAFHDENPDTCLILVLPGNYIPLWENLFSSLSEDDRFMHKIVEGGSTRTDSVKNGLTLVPAGNSLVAVHDGARPLVSPGLISLAWETALYSGAAIPVVPVTDSLRKVKGEESQYVDRSEYVAVQTPQVFDAALLKDAYEKAGQQVFSDDASVVEHNGHKVAMFPGNTDNIKITNPKDMAIATVLMANNA